MERRKINYGKTTIPSPYKGQWNRRSGDDRRQYKNRFVRFMTMPVNVFIYRTMEEIFG